MCCGQIGCEAINWAMKRYFKHPRPEQMHGKGYGMPSSHAQFMCYFAVYLSLWLLVRIDYFPLRRRVRDAFLISLLALAVCTSRYYTN